MLSAAAVNSCIRIPANKDGFIHSIRVGAEKNHNVVDRVPRRFRINPLNVKLAGILLNSCLFLGILRFYESIVTILVPVEIPAFKGRARIRDHQR